MANILLIEEDSDVARSMARTLATRGHKIFYVSSPDEGIRALRYSLEPHVTERFDAIICEHSSDGQISPMGQERQMAEVVRPLFPKMPIIVTGTSVLQTHGICAPAPLPEPTAFFDFREQPDFTALADLVAKSLSSPHRPTEAPRGLKAQLERTSVGLWL